MDIIYIKGWVTLKMRKIITTLVLFILLCGCDPYANKQPWNFKNSVWVCSEPYITYGIDPNSIETASTIIDGKEIIFDLCFNANRVDAWKYKEQGGEKVGDEILFSGTCSYSETEFIIKVDVDSDVLFKGEYQELVFTRQEEKNNKEHTE